MRYEFECSKCEHIQEIEAPISQGPPPTILCEKCGALMTRIYECTFLLLGDGWPGRDIKKKELEGGKAKEEVEDQFNKDRSDKKLINEVLQVRRKGHKATAQYKKDNPAKWKDYQKAIKKGVR